MAGPSSATPDDYKVVLRDEFKRFADNIENALDAVYKLGFEHGDSAAISRILKAAQPGTNGRSSHALRPSSFQTQRDEVPGEGTHKLIEAALRATPSGKATPTEIRMSPLNKDQIKRDAIRNALRRGRKSGRYVSDGKGRYSLGKTEAAK